ncbi:MAG: hypothetical protein AB2615_07185, partial [Candidatus Thiodiazotropha sp.]
AVLVLIVIGLFSKWKKDGEISLPVNSCKVHTVNVTSEPFIINGEFDAGFKVVAVVENKGSASQLVVTAKLTSSEGDLQRRQTVPFNENESKSLTYQFHEPTIGATNVHAYVSCQ